MPQGVVQYHRAEAQRGCPGRGRNQRRQGRELLIHVVLHDQGGETRTFGLASDALPVLQRAAGMAYPEAKPALPDGCHQRFPA